MKWQSKVEHEAQKQDYVTVLLFPTSKIVLVVVPCGSAAAAATAAAMTVTRLEGCCCLVILVLVPKREMMKKAVDWGAAGCKCEDSIGDPGYLRMLLR